MKINSPQTRINLPASKLFEMAGDLQNFSRYMSDQVKIRNAAEDYCSFTIENIAEITLKLLEKTPFTQIRFVAENTQNIPLFLTLCFTAVSENETDVIADLDIEIPIFLKPLLQKPLEHFVKTISEKIKTEAEKN